MSSDAAPAIDAKGQDHRPVGRPRESGTDTAILQAAIELLAEAGLRKTTIDAVAARAGVARATVYLRWPTRDALIAAAARQALGQPIYPLTGDLATDLATGARRARTALAQPLFRAIFPELARGLLARPPASVYDEIAPNRQRLAAELVATAEAAGFRDDIDPTLPFDLIVGATLNHLLATGDTPSEADAARMVEVVIGGLRRRA
ncbi:MAG: TetR/AcrR family transcriptional regulator C-terminal ligand-binding domain-containing protein [Chloroflexi bacterium]|nr:TetR/AcrR family transcriptional regulator C-terminal ligand-binding domain-containing protein [Chloroflexota bacterium]